MPNIQSWNVTSGEPVQLHRAELSLERELEDWIESNPGLVNPDLLIVGRQMHLNGGKLRLDLLAVDRLGSYWALIEIKRGFVTVETIAQALRYVATVNELQPKKLAESVEAYLTKRGTTTRKFLKQHQLDKSIFDDENRNLVIYVVGTHRASDLESVAKYLNSNGTQVNVVTFDVFQSENGDKLLIRDLEELETADTPIEPPRTLEEIELAVPPPDVKETPATKKAQRKPQKKSTGKATKRRSKSRKPATIEELFARADKAGFGEAYRALYKAATSHGLYPRTYAHSIMYTPPSHKGRMLIFAPVNQGEVFQVSVSAFAEFFPISSIRANMILGLGGVYTLNTESVEIFAKDLGRLFDVIERNSLD